MKICDKCKKEAEHAITFGFGSDKKTADLCQECYFKIYKDIFGSVIDLIIS